jgi:hypothetical protein
MGCRVRSPWSGWWRLRASPVGARPSHVLVRERQSPIRRARS